MSNQKKQGREIQGFTSLMYMRGRWSHPALWLPSLVTCTRAQECLGLSHNGRLHSVARGLYDMRYWSDKGFRGQAVQFLVFK